MRYSKYTLYREEFGAVPSRFMCDVLEDMRKQYETRNFSGLLGSIEQLQVMAYRMEAALGDKRTIEEYESNAADLSRDLKDKRREIRKLENDIRYLKEKYNRYKGVVNKVEHEYKKTNKTQKIPDVK